MLLVDVAGDDDEAKRLAWRELYERHAPTLYGWLRDKERFHRHDPDDVLVLTFEEVFNGAASKFFAEGKLDTASAKTAVRKWLFGILRNKLLQLESSRPRESPLPEKYDPPDPGEASSNDEEAESPVLQAAREVLTDEEWEIVWLKLQYVSDDMMTHPPSEFVADIATKLGVKPATIRKKYERALEKVKERLIHLELVPQ